MRRSLVLLLAVPVAVLAGASVLPGAASALPLPTGSASATPTPTASATPTGSPTASASPSPSGGLPTLPIPLPLPTGSATPTATATPRPATPTVTVSPTTTTAGQSARVSGTAEPGATVELFAYSRPSTAYRAVRSGVVAADGTFVFDVKPSGSTRLYATSRGVDSPSTVLTVRTAVSLTVTRTGERAYRFSGRTVPAKPGQLIDVRYRRGTGFVRVARGRVAGDGTWSVDRTFGGTGTFGFSATSPTTVDNAGGTSNEVRTAVR